MKSIAELNIKAPTTDESAKYLNTRSVALKPFVEKIDGDRKRSGYKPYGAAEIARCMSHIATDDLEYFYRQCTAAKSFGALWTWYCKPKDGQPREIKNAPWKRT